MQIEVILAGISITGTMIIGIGMIKTWRRNGIDQRDRDLKLAEDRAERDTRLEGKVDELHHMSDIHMARTTEVKKELAALTKHCAGTVAGFKEKHAGAERRLANLEEDAR